MLCVDAVERADVVVWQTAVLAQAQGAEVDIPQLGDLRRQFEQWLVSEPDRLVDDPVARALGVSAA